MEEGWKGVVGGGRVVKHKGEAIGKPANISTSRGPHVIGVSEMLHARAAW